MDATKYVKPLMAGGWEVKLGAGMLPFVLTQQDVVYFETCPQNGTCALPFRMGLDDFCRKANGFAAVKEYLERTKYDD